MYFAIHFSLVRVCPQITQMNEWENKESKKEQTSKNEQTNK